MKKLTIKAKAALTILGSLIILIILGQFTTLLSSVNIPYSETSFEFINFSSSCSYNPDYSSQVSEALRQPAKGWPMKQSVDYEIAFGDCFTASGIKSTEASIVNLGILALLAGVGASILFYKK